MHVEQCMTNSCCKCCKLLPQAKSYGKLKESGIKVCKGFNAISTFQEFWPF